MIPLIIFYCLFAIYTSAFIWYIIYHVQRYRHQLLIETKALLQQDIKITMLNLLYLSLIILTICTLVIYKVDLGISTNEPWQIGVGLSCATFIFYILFLLWDIVKYRVKKFFMNKHQIELTHDDLFNLPIILIITANAILLLEVVMTIINMVAFLRS